MRTPHRCPYVRECFAEAFPCLTDVYFSIGDPGVGPMIAQDRGPNLPSRNQRHEYKYCGAQHPFQASWFRIEALMNDP